MYLLPYATQSSAMSCTRLSLLQLVNTNIAAAHAIAAKLIFGVLMALNFGFDNGDPFESNLSTSCHQMDLRIMHYDIIGLDSWC